LRVYTRIERPAPSAQERLAQAGVGDISDAMQGMSVIDHGIRQVYTPMRRICGPAITVDLTPGDGLMLRAALEAAQPGDVIVANAHGATERATLGGSVAMHMAHRNVAGLVVDGAVRDVAEMRELDFPVMARAVTPRSGTTGAGWGEVNVPVACGGVVVHPGDLIVGDEEGLVVVPRAWAQAVVDMLGETGHGIYQPETVRDRLAALPDDAHPVGQAAVRKAMEDRHGTFIDGVFRAEDPVN
jgi:RraA family protein